MLIDMSFAYKSCMLASDGIMTDFLQVKLGFEELYWYTCFKIGSTLKSSYV